MVNLDFIMLNIKKSFIFWVYFIAICIGDCLHRKYVIIISKA